MRRRWVYKHGRAIEVAPGDRTVNPTRHAGLAIIGDSCEPFVSQLDGKVYDSKSRYRKTLKSHGMVEIGNDKVSPSKPKDNIRGDIERAIAQGNI